MRKEKRELKKRIAATVGGKMGELECREFNRLINAFEKTVREDCAKVADSHRGCPCDPGCDTHTDIAAAIRGRK